MDFHLEHEVRLNAETKHKSLYMWAINEIAEGETIGLDQIPWESTLWFTATSCKLSDSIEISAPFRFKFTVTTKDGKATEQESGGKEDTIDRRQAIQIELRPTGPHGSDDAPTFSMLGTKRLIKTFRLSIVQLTDPAENEQCSAWGCASYTTEGADFIDETTDDCLVFYLAVKPEAFARYVSKITQGELNEIVFRVGKVDGFYSEWSPSITTDKVKVLPADSEHKISLPPGCEIEPPRLGKVGDVALYMNRRLEFVPTQTSGEPETKLAPHDAGRAIPADIPILQSLKRAAWFTAVLLALILIEILLRR